MDKEQLDSVAAHLISSYLETAIYSRQFLDDHASPPTLMSKRHHLLAVVQAAIAQGDRYELMPDYAEYGRVQFKDHQIGRTFLLRSSAAVAIEKSKRFEQFALDIPVPASDVQLVIYEFSAEGLNLSVADTVQQARRKRLIACGFPEFVGLWPYTTPEGQRSPFSQSGADPFGDVGGLGDVEDDDEGEEGVTA